ncbi:MAG: GatB/YqeY domain-containing protein [Prolixibacteraceae bacterium]|nr:GatB/YqeY domain-containing protein [Prolixibacteraceae bacterium]
MAIVDEINTGIKEAMKAKDKVRLEALRGIKKVLLEARTAAGAAAEVTDEQAIKLIGKLAKQGKDSASIYAQQGRPDLEKDELDQVAVFESFLPVQLTDEDLTKKVKEIIDKAGAQTMKDMGKVMGIATKELAGKADGKAISEKVRSLLQ